jgi:hypothetical protein
MDRLTRALTVTALAATMTVVGAGSASADRWWGGDRSGDVQQVGISPEPPPCGTVKQSTAPQDTTTDVVGLSVRHEGTSVELRAHFRDLTQWGERYLTFDVGTDDGDYTVWVVRSRKSERLEASLYRAPEPPESFDECGGYVIVVSGVPCPDLTVTRSPARDFVSVVIPRSCVGSPRWVKAGVRTSRTIGDRHRSDVWGTNGTQPVGFTGPFGPRVRQSR